jgi:hypothetical protein
MAKPKPPRRAREDDEPQPLEAGLRTPASEPSHDHAHDDDVDEYLLQKVVEANGEHLRTMRWGLGLGTLMLLLDVGFVGSQFGSAAVAIVALGVAGPLLGIGLHALARQLELLRRAVAATDHFVFGPADEQER